MIKFNLSNRVAIVTGGAQGFGLAITERFIQSGAKVIIWDVDKEAAENAIKKIKATCTFFGFESSKSMGNLNFESQQIL